MAQLFVPLTGPFKKITGSGFNNQGESLERPAWRGAELGGLDTFPDVWGGVSEAEFHDWIIGVRHPLYKKDGPAMCRFLDPDPAVRRAALELATTAAQAAHHVGARYIIFPFPWPGLKMPGVDLQALGWTNLESLVDGEGWSEESVALWSRDVFQHLAQLQQEERIKIALEIDGPNPYFFEGDVYTGLFEAFPDLSLCVDTGRLGLLARTHRQDPLELLRRWLPWTRYLHLNTSLWDANQGYVTHLPTDGTHTADRWPYVTPAADMAKLVVEAQPRATIVLNHNPKSVSPDTLEQAHAWAASVVGD